ncbi:hypothetical protein F506_13920 [Herbaspirillum hiltneri N3]|uniref:Uncharacterized protein n=1 Tax=Herbaspirillum hiltneri N3 TaxID=1262470 RepID=A0ABM5V216_9BURK|nr:hypothetical protein [Herbaspirillum hiltneri]AKZ63615.1 hypothetical protein F506_13920 [Herbaspirillum hiltneri N3]
MHTTESRQTAPTRIQLSAGQSYYLWSRRDTVLVVESGSIRLRESPEWLSDAVLRTLLTIHEGQHYQIERGGWICLHATRAADVLHYASEPARYFSLESLVRLAMVPVRRLRHMAVQLLAPR